MKKEDDALFISNPRLISAAYFGVLAVVVTIIIDSTLYAIGIKQILPAFQAILLAVVVASLFGAIFGKQIIYSKKPYRWKAFLWGFLMVIAALPFYDLIFFFLFKKHSSHAFPGDASLGELAFSYLLIVIYSFLVAGLWLAIAAGLAAIYLRGKLVYDILHSKSDGQKLSPEEKKMSPKLQETKPDKHLLD
ncbi:hypothetical protein [Legionella fairfieldensis]|uniref:hypothetical protein n=1 Tax=Legionella fairfieldensis TaxID=45064 RepID=UPI000490A179|nr:hypothetical protein [Legionella fairfieldensis]